MKNRKIPFIFIFFIGLVFMLSACKKGLPYEMLYHETYYSVYNCDKNIKECVIPEIYKNRPVTAISSETFKDCSLLESITLPNSITDIDDSAFRDCTSLKNITLPENLKYLGPNVFNGCSSLESITLPKGINVINTGLFKGCTSLKTININGGIEKIYNVAF